ncbi:MAG: helix-turn-helix transcriptional regulator [Microgenomates group bacterium]
MNKIDKKILKHATPWEEFREEFTRDFTERDWKNVESEVRYYYLLVGLKKARKKLGLTQEQVAKRAHLPRTTISKIESGKHNPTISTLMSIATALNKSLQITVV